jgi:acyl-CoA synthetase (AMP-forming)/AMP-acid ligase II
VSASASVWSLIEARASATPDAVMVIDEDERSLTFAEYRRAAEETAAGLLALGIAADTKVSWQLPTRIESFVLVGALSRLGAVQNPMLPIYREREISFMLREMRPRTMIVPSVWKGFSYEALAHRVTEGLATTDGLECRVLVCDRVLPHGDPATLPPPPTDPDVTRWVFYTSGTTAAPKGAVHSDATIIAGAQGAATAFEFAESDRYPVVFPFTHIGGIGMMVVQLLTGSGAIVVEQYDPERTPPFLGAHGVTIAAGGTPVALLYLQHQRRHREHLVFPRLRAVMTGASPKPAGLHAELRDELGGVGAVSVYGLTEAPFLVAASVRDPDDKLASTEGRAVPGVELRVVAPDGTVCAPGVTGEIRARGAVLCKGYVDTTRDAESLDEEGFFRTGDLGSIDADGYVTISGRLKDVIIRKGENISAPEVEDILYSHPAIAELAVVGLPDDVVGERCCAVLVLADDVAPPTLDELTEWCAQAGLAKQKWPEQVEICDELPRNASGKVLKHELVARYKRGR